MSTVKWMAHDNTPFLASEWRAVVHQTFGVGALRLIDTRLFASACPECAAAPDAWYGWNPLCRVVWDLPPEPRFLLKEQCFGCGYHHAMWMGNAWTVQERRQAYELIVFVKHFNVSMEERG